MRKRMMHFTALVLAVCLLWGSFVLPAQAHNPGGAEFTNTYRNTGNQRADIIGVAMTQLGYRELDGNDTKFSDWIGMPKQEWCAAFVSWCARQAEVSTSIIKPTSWAHPNSFKVTELKGTEYTPQPGDLFFTEKYEHVGLVWYVEGDFFYTIEGNAKYHDYTVPNDPTVESYYVMSNKRLITHCTFGVPAYEGCDGEHTYVRAQEEAHPHNVYYTCTDCGDQYYTGYTERVADCEDCFWCGCSSEHAGYYQLLPNTDYLRIRTEHSWSSDALCYVTLGSVVYVHGINKDGDWAYIEFDGIRGHIPASYLKKYHNPPEAPTLTVAQASYFQGENVSLHWNIPDHTEFFRMRVLHNGSVYLQPTLEVSDQLILPNMPAGSYRVELLAGNRAGASPVSVAEFTVTDSYTISYDLAGGQGSMEAQNQTIGQPVTLPDAIPERDGYTFLGWTDREDTLALYQPGSAFYGSRDLTLTLSYASLEATCRVEVISYIPGDLDGNRKVNRDDVIALLLHVSMPEEFPIHIPADFTGNGKVDREDVIALLLHVSMPEAFPLQTPSAE